MRVLDLFAGLRGWSDPWLERGHEVVTLDYDKQFDVDIHADILDVTAQDFPWVPDVVLASPPCEGFTVMNIGKNWYHDGRPKTDRAAHALRIVAATLTLIEDLAPRWFIIENPRGKLRALPIMRHLERRTVTYCQFGELRMKPTDLWGVFPPGLDLPAPCRNGDPCHVRAPRGSRTPGSTQGITGASNRAEIPRGLSLAICAAAESAAAGGWPTRLHVLTTRPRSPQQVRLWEDIG